MTTFQIVATRKDGPDYDRRIDAIQLADGRIFPLDSIISAHDAGDRFWTITGNGLRADAFPMTHPVTRRRYMTTSRDGITPNNLLHLPNC